ncbi:MAG: hypothetical protein M0Q13_15685 [Methanothrix sp.]|jgi:hypothetical protein|nr:hypothetical protein [Methanothrix sp.]
MDVYFVTCIGYTADYLDDIDLSKGKLYDRCWGYFFDLEIAKNQVKNNSLDIAEDGYYNYAVIEKVHEGILPVFYGIDEIQWFKYNKNSDKYEDCNKPKWSNTTASWSIG